MIAENVFKIAIHLSEKEMEKLLNMLNKKVNTISFSKGKNTRGFNDKDAIEYLLKNVFSKRKQLLKIDYIYFYKQYTLSYTI